MRQLKSTTHSLVFALATTYGFYLAWPPLGFIWFGLLAFAGAIESLKQEEEENEAGP